MNNNLIKCPYCDEEIDKESVRCEYCDELIKRDYVIVNNSLINNSYHILWLDISSSQKQISKRAKDILKYLAIWEVPDFENDLYFTNEYRNEIFVKSAMDSLTNPKDKIINTFFWFDIENDDDKNIFSIYNTKNYNNAINLFKKSDNKKNLAILYTLLLLDPNISSDYSEYVENSLDLFKEIQDDDKFWRIFERKYFLFDDISTNKDLISEFRKDLGKHLSNIFYDISAKLWDDTILKKFHKYFKNTKWNKANEQVEKIYLDLGKFSRELEDMNISEDWVFDDDEKVKVKKIHYDITQLLRKLEDLWLYDDSKTLIIRDTVAEVFRTIMLDLNNELNEEDESLKILNYALDIVGTDWLKHKINEEYKYLTTNLKFKPILQLLNDEDFIWAYKQIEELEKEDLNKEDIKSLTNLKKRSIFWRLWKWFIEWKNLFEKEKYTEALKYFTSIEELAKKNIDLFEWINEEALNELISWIKDYLWKIDKWELKAKEVFDYIDDLRAKVIKQLSEEDWYFFIFYIDSISYWYLSELNVNPKKIEKPNILFTWWWIWVSIYWDTTYFTFFWIPLAPINTWNVESLWNSQYQFYGKKEMPKWKKIWRFIWWAAIIIYILALIWEWSSWSSYNYNTSTSSNSNNEYNLWEYRCYSSSYDKAISMKPVDPWLDYMANEIDRLQNELDNTYVNEYSQSSVDSYNLKVTTLKSKINTYNSELESYNAKVDNYNNFLENNCYK